MTTQTLAELLAIEDANRSEVIYRLPAVSFDNNVAWLERRVSSMHSWYKARVWNGSEIIDIPGMTLTGEGASFDDSPRSLSISLEISGNNVICHYAGYYYYPPNHDPNLSPEFIYFNSTYWWNGTKTVDLGNVNPQLSGNNMVWAASDGNDTEIYFWNGNTTVQLTNNSTNDLAPQISGNVVSWQKVDGTIETITVKNGGFLGTPNRDLINAEDGNDVVTSDFASLQQNDKMDGGIGTDIFILTVGTTDTKVTINAGSSTNQISSVAGLTVVNFEQFDLARFIGTLNFVGSTSNDWIKSGRGNDLLDGGLGADQLMGGLGNDTYILDSISDVVTENLNEGQDRIQASVSCSLTDNVETLLLVGTTNINGTGNNSDNSITGNSGNNLLKGLNGNDTLSGAAGNDTLVGGLGSDRLTGGDGADQFLFGSGVAFNSANFGVDAITDFAKGSDKIALSKASFTKLTTAINNSLQSTEFALINSAANELTLAGSSSAKVVYNQATGNLFYNPDAAIAGLTGGGQFGIFSNRPSLSVTDFLVQA